MPQVEVRTVKMSRPEAQAIAKADVIINGIYCHGGYLKPGPHGPRFVFPKCNSKFSRVRFEDRRLWDAVTSEVVEAVEALTGRSIKQLLKEKADAVAA